MKKENENLNKSFKLVKENLKNNYEAKINSLNNQIRILNQSLEDEQNRNLISTIKYKDDIEKISNTLHKSQEENESNKRDKEILKKKLKEIMKQNNGLLSEIRNQELRESEQARVIRAINSKVKNGNSIYGFWEKIKAKIQDHYIIILMILIPLAIYMIYRRIFMEDDY